MEDERKSVSTNKNKGNAQGVLGKDGLTLYARMSICYKWKRWSRIAPPTRGHAYHDVKGFEESQHLFPNNQTNHNIAKGEQSKRPQMLRLSNAACE